MFLGSLCRLPSASQSSGIPAAPLHAGVLKDTEAPARVLGIQIEPVKIVNPSDFEDGFQLARAQKAGAAWILGDSLFFTHRDRLAMLALNARLPTLFALRQHVEAGGLASYGPSQGAMYRRAARYVDQILKGAKPADLPVEQPTKFDLVVNLKTAKTLGLAIPPSLLLRADHVIE